MFARKNLLEYMKERAMSVNDGGRIICWLSQDQSTNLNELAQNQARTRNLLVKTVTELHTCST
jgi:hypothetical protein